jgi:hypothetical protein
MKQSKTPLSVSLKIGLEDEWLVSEASVLNTEKFQCLVERSIPLQSEVQVVMIIPFIVEGKRNSQKIDCSGIVKSVECVQDEKKEMKYRIEVAFKGLSASARGYISEFSKSNQA